MHFERGEMDFREADRAFAELMQRRDAGEIGAEEFDAERQRLMVLDGQGRWWAKSRETGEWNYHDGKGWVAGTPPGHEPDTKTIEVPVATSEESGSGADATHADEPRTETGERSRRRSGASYRWPIVALAILVVTILGGAFYFLNGRTDQTTGVSNNDVVVPNLVGSASVEEARKVAGDAFDVVEDGSVESKEPVGSVVEQDQTQGEKLEGGSTIFVKVSKGVEVLEVVGNDRDPAIELLEGRLFAVSVKTAGSPEYSEGQVISQEPEGGQFVEARSDVTLTIGGGSNSEASNNDKPVPDVIGDSVEDARKVLEDAGFQYEMETVQSDQSTGTVVSTDPEAGAAVDPDTTKVAIRESSGSSSDDGSSGVSDGGAGSGDSGSGWSAAGDQYTPPAPYNPPDSSHQEDGS